MVSAAKLVNLPGIIWTCQAAGESLILRTMTSIRLMFAGLFFMCACTGPASDNPFQQELEKPPYKELTEQIRQEPKNDSLYFERGILLMNTNQPVAAQLDLEKAWSIKPKPDYALALAEQMMDAPKALK
jgi:hypothetical protein